MQRVFRAYGLPRWFRGMGLGEASEKEKTCRPIGKEIKSQQVVHVER